MAIIPLELWGAAADKWIIAILIVIFSFLIGKGAYYFFKNWVRKITSKTKSPLDDLIVEAIEKPVVFILLIAGIYFAFYSLEITNTFYVNLFNQVIALLIIAVIAFFAMQVSDALIKGILKPLTKKTRSELDDQLMPLISKGVKAVILLFAGIILLERFGVDVTALVAGIGIGGLAIAFAAKETISNVFGGISLLIDKSFKIGDKIQLESGEVGIVKAISLRSTKILTYDNEIITIPNAIIANNRLKNFVQPDKKVRVNIPFSVAYGADVDKVTKVALDAVKKLPDFISDPEPFVNFEAMSAYSLDFKVFWWVGDYNNAVGSQKQAVKELYKALLKNKINIPFPTQTVYLKK